MREKENIDLKILLSFTTTYQKLQEEGEITAEQLDHILTLLDSYRQYSPREFESELKKIFPT